MYRKNYLFIVMVVLFIVSCEQSKQFKYYIENRTTDELNVYIDYSISAKGIRSADTLSIPAGEEEMIYSHSGLGGFYTGTIENIRFSGKDTLKQEWRNRAQSEANKHFFRRNSWKITYRGDDTEHYRFRVTENDLSME